jgi:hypothetical protein
MTTETEQADDARERSIRRHFDAAGAALTTSSEAAARGDVHAAADALHDYYRAMVNYHHDAGYHAVTQRDEHRANAHYAKEVNARAAANRADAQRRAIHRLHNPNPSNR